MLLLCAMDSAQQEDEMLKSTMLPRMQQRLAIILVEQVHILETKKIQSGVTLTANSLFHATHTTLLHFHYGNLAYSLQMKSSEVSTKNRSILQVGIWSYSIELQHFICDTMNTAPCK